MITSRELITAVLHTTKKDVISKTLSVMKGKRLTESEKVKMMQKYKNR